MIYNDILFTKSGLQLCARLVSPLSISHLVLEGKDDEGGWP